ncbi:hypothetical protein [Streptomyces sp. NPDC058542]|uniref:hypothetical protein n=1 Tax=Streptomyces sp. NPDC058542 TaxID=3346543 RepID=UPI003654FA91
MKLIIGSIGTTVSVDVKEDREPWQRPTATSGVIYVDNGHGFECAPEEYTAREARELAAALLRAADEAEDVEPLDEGNARSTLENILVSGHIVADSTGSLDFGDVDRYRDAVAERVRSDTAAFIRSNIDLQGLDFPDAESVAVWLEEGR